MGVPSRPACSLSVIVPTYGSAPYLAETLASIEHQTFGPHEVVVVDDGSMPATELPRTTLRVRLIRIGHVGIAGARNAGLDATTAPLVHICDHDDVLEARFYERVVDMFTSQPSVDVVHAACGFIDEAGVQLSGILPESAPAYGTPGASLRTLLTMNPIASVATVFRREVAAQLDGFRRLDFVHDWDFWLRAASSGATFAFLGEVLAWHRVHPNQQSARERTPLILAESRRMLRSQKLPRRDWAARERTIADLHLAEAAHHAAEAGQLVAAGLNVALAVPGRPLASLRAAARIRRWRSPSRRAP